MSLKPTCQLDSNSPTQRATSPLHQRPRCQLENRASPAQIHHGPGRCQGEWIHFNAGRYNMFFVFVKAGERDGQREKERERRNEGYKAGWQRRGGIGSGLREGEEGGSERGKWWLCFKEQETEQEHLTHMISIKGCATCR